MNLNKTLNIANYIGMIFLLAGILFQLNDLPYALIFLASGAIFLLVIRIFNYINAPDTNKRLYAIMVFSALFFVTSAILIYMHRNYWLIAIFISAILDLYVSFRKPEH